MEFSGIIMCNILKFQREITFLSTVQKKWYKKTYHISSTQKPTEELSDMTTLNACHAKQKTALVLFFHHTVYVIDWDC